MVCRSTLIVVAPLAAMLGLDPTSARACEPWGAVELLGPDPSGSIPANAAIRVRSFPGLTAADLSAIVDGLPTTLSEVEPLARGGYGYDDRAFTVDGLAAEQHVVVQWCPDECIDLIEYDAAPPWLDAPAPPLSLLFDLHDYPGSYGDFGGATCSGLEDLRWWIKSEAPGPSPDIELFYVFEAHAADDDELLRFRVYELVQGTTVTPPVIGLAELLDGDDPPTSICIRGFAMDSTGQRSDALETCLPCRHSVVPATTGPDGLPLEPTWTQAEIHAGGPCEAGVPPPWDPGPPDDEPDTGGLDESGGEDTGSNAASTGADQTGTMTGFDSDSGSAGSDTPLDRGCACDVVGTDDAPRMLGALVLVALLRLRRRR